MTPDCSPGLLPSAGALLASPAAEATPPSPLIISTLRRCRFHNPHRGQVHHLLGRDSVLAQVRGQACAREQGTDGNGLCHVLEKMESDVSGLDIGEDENVGVVSQLREREILLPEVSVEGGSELDLAVYDQVRGELLGNLGRPADFASGRMVDAPVGGG